MSHKLPSLVIKRRRNLAKSPEAKGDPRKQNLWAVRTFDGVRLVLSGDLSLDHFFFTEGDPSVRSARYPTEDDSAPLGGEAASFNAIVTHLDGRIEGRHVRANPLDPTVPRDAERLQAYREAARCVGGSYVEITSRTLDQAQQRIHNWTRLLAAYRRCAQHPLEVLEQQLLERVTLDGECTVGATLARAVDQPKELIVAALIGLLRKRQIRSDLDDATWSLHTRIQVRQP